MQSFRLGEDVQVIDSRNSPVILPATSEAILEFVTRAATSNLVMRATQAMKPMPCDRMSGAYATDPKSLGARNIALDE